MKKFTLLLSAMLMTVMSFAGVVTFGPEDFNGKGTTSVGSPVEVTKDGVTVSCDKGYGNSYAFRCYANGVVTISATENISSLEFAFDTYNDRYYNGGLEEVYTVGASSWSTTLASQARFTSIKVTLGEGGSDTPDNGDDNGGNEGGGTTPPTPPAEGVITCAQAVEICKATGETATTETYTIRGYVTELKEAYNSQFGNATYWMADEKGGTNQLQAYRVKPVNASDQAVKVNDYVEVVGTLVNFKGNTPEVNAGGTYTIITAADGGTTPPTPPTPPTNGAIVFDADVDKGNAGTDSNNATAYQITKNGVTLDVTSGILGTYNNEMHYRIYKNQTLTVTSTVGNIAKIEFTCTANGDEKYGPGCFTASTGEYGHDGAAVGTWTGDAATITFTASANQVRATQIVVTLASATAVEDVTVGATPVKVIENGQVLIIRGEHIYNVLGAQVK